MNIILKKIVRENLELAIKIQNEIFPDEDGALNFIECVEQNPYRKELDYYIVFDNDKPIGVTGIYSYHEYPSDAWLGWFGVVPHLRKKGSGSIIFDKTLELAKNKKYKTLRLYTDENYKDAHKLYTKKGMIKEVYDNKEDKDQYEPENLITYIFSISLTDKKIEKWNNKTLGLKEQGIKENYKGGRENANNYRNGIFN